MANEPNPASKPARDNAHSTGPKAGSPAGADAAHDHESAPDHPAVSGRGAVVGVVLLLIVVVALGIYGVWKRRHNDEVLADTTQQMAAPSVIALPPKSGAPVDNFVLPGNVSAYTDAAIFARTSGYLTKWYYDIGARVKKGALLAEISTPELDQQLAQAEADLATSEATASNAKTQSERYKDLVKSDAVSQQDTDTFTNQAASTSAAVRSAQANVQRLKELQGFEKVFAPFDGVVTARGTDTGQLVSQGSGTELFHMQALQTLRVYTNVPEVYTAAIKHGEKIDLGFPEHPGQLYQGTLVRTAGGIDPTNRTLLVEIDVDNRKGELMPGSLAQVHFKTSAVAPTFIVPASALIFRHEGLRIATVVNSNVAHLVPVIIGQDNGATVEVVSGLNGNDRVIQDPPDSIIEGEKLHVESPNQNGNPPAPGGPSATGSQQNTMSQPESPQKNPGGK
ncbi:MAG TPA: efflux RND transporter periplasmic adaptor subunit [Terracidiphilus sp.]